MASVEIVLNFNSNSQGSFYSLYDDAKLESTNIAFAITIDPESDGVPTIREALSKYGYYFKFNTIGGENLGCWCVSSSGVGKRYRPNDKITKEMNNVPLCAVFPLKLTYDANGGLFPDGKIKKDYSFSHGNTEILIPEIPTRKNHKFIAWQDDQGNRYQPEEEVYSEENLYLTAVWEDNSSPFKFYRNGTLVSIPAYIYKNNKFQPLSFKFGQREKKE